MKKLLPILLALSCVFSLTASAGILGDDSGEVDVAAVGIWAGTGDFDLFSYGAGSELSYREWFEGLPWGIGASVGIQSWQVDKHAGNPFKWHGYSKYDGDALVIPLGLNLYFAVIEWDNWNLVAEAGAKYLFVNEDIDLYNADKGKREDVEIDNGILGNIGLSLEFLMTEHAYMTFTVGYQGNFMKCDTEIGGRDACDATFDGAYGRFGFKALI